MPALSRCRCLSPRRGSVSSRRSPNPACRFPAPGSPVGSCVSHTNHRVDSGIQVVDRSDLCASCTTSALHPVSRPAGRRACSRLDDIELLWFHFFAYACDGSGISALYAGSRHCHSRQLSSFPHRSTPEAPFLDRHYPASSVVRASPPPRPARPVPRGVPVGACHATDGASRVASLSRVHACHRHYPGRTAGCSCRSTSPATAAFPETQAGRLLHHPFRGLLSVHCSLRPACSPSPLRTLYTGSFSRFVTSTTVPIATGWNDSCRVGVSPTERTRLPRRTERCGLVSTFAGTGLATFVPLHRHRTLPMLASGRSETTHGGCSLETRLVCPDAQAENPGASVPGRRATRRETGARRRFGTEWSFEPDGRRSPRARDVRSAWRQVAPGDPGSGRQAPHLRPARSPRACGQVNGSSRSIVQRRVLALFALAVAILFFVYDLIADWLYEEEYGTVHFTLELIVFAGVSMALILGVRDLRRLRTELSHEQRRIEVFSTALSESIDIRMDEWRMTPSEKGRRLVHHQGVPVLRDRRGARGQGKHRPIAGYHPLCEGGGERTGGVRRRDPAAAPGLHTCRCVSSHGG